MRRRTGTQTDTQTRVTNIHFASAAPGAKCNEAAKISMMCLTGQKLHSNNSICRLPQRAGRLLQLATNEQRNDGQRRHRDRKYKTIYTA